MSLTGLDGDSPSRISTVARISRTLADSQNEIAGAIARWAPCEECAQPVKRDWNLCPNCDFLRRSRNGLDGRYSSPLRTERSVMSSGRSGSRSPGSLRSRRSSKSKPPHSAPDVGSIAEAAHVVPDNAWVEEHADHASCEAVLPEPRDAVPLERQKSFCKGFHQPRATVPHFPRVSVAPPSGPLVEASGVKWSNAGATKPKGGRELKNSKLQNALKSKTAAATAEFTEDEWKSFSIHDLSIGDFIKSVSFGLNWQKVSSKPKPARELFNSKLSTALASHTELTVAEWEACGIFDLRRGDFIKVGDSLFTPAMGEAYFTPAVRGTRFQKEQMRHVCDALSSMFALHDSDRQTVTAEVVAGGLSNWLFKVTASPSPIASSTLAAPMTRANCLSEQRLLTFPEHPLLLARRRAADMLGKPVLVRVFGPLALDRETENTVCAQVFLSGIGPRVLATFANGRVEEFLEGFRTLEPHEFLGDVHGRAVAHCLAQLHSKPLLRAIGSGGGADTGGGDMGADSIWKRVERWINIALTKGIRAVDVGRAGEVKSVLMTVRQHVHKWKECLQNMARSGDCACRFWAQVRLCHNDLHVNNIMAHAQKVSRVTLIDFEYACANYIGLDVCNSLANIPFILFLQGKTPTYDAKQAFPADAEIQRWLHAYLEQRLADNDDDAELQRWMKALLSAAESSQQDAWGTALRALKRFLPMAQLQWIPWGIMQLGLREQRSGGGAEGARADDGVDFLALALTEWAVYEYYLDNLRESDPAFFSSWDLGLLQNEHANDDVDIGTPRPPADQGSQAGIRNNVEVVRLSPSMVTWVSR